MNLELKVLDLGRVGYEEVEKKQLELVKDISDGLVDGYMIIAEHPPTISIGRSKERNNVYASPEELKRKGITLVKSERAGGASYLGPGQVTFYPVINLNGTEIGDYLRAIEKIAHEIATEMGIKTFLGRVYNSTTEREYNSAWYTDENGKHHKFLAQGYKIPFINGKRIINCGGFSINVDKRAHEHFNLIDHCGFKLSEVGAISFEEMLGYNPGKNTIKKYMLKAFAEKFGYNIVYENKEVFAK